MASAPTHAFVAVIIEPFLFGRRFPRWVLLTGAFFSILPDFDVIAFALGIPYEHPLGHRGLTHSIAFALVLASLSAFVVPKRAGLEAQRWALAFYWFLCLLSHGLLDALTNGGLGVAFWLPLDTGRYFFPWRPIMVSPIGIGTFLSRWGAAVLVSELIYVWLPLLALWLVLGRRGGRKSGVDSER